jgi:hypothetical protein
MRSKHVTILMGIMASAAVLFSGGTEVVRANPPAPVAGNVTGASVGAQVVLYDQLALGQTNGAVSQNFETASNSSDNQSADDFPIPAGMFFWSINTIEVDGFYQGGSGFQAATVNVYFYNTAGSLPGTAVYPASFAPSAGGPTGDFVITLSPPARLLAGRTYWVSVQANLDSGGGSTAHQWQWGFRSPQTGNPAAWINPGNGYGVDCIVWKTLTDCAFPVGAATDLQFRLSGSQINITATVYLPIVSR